MQTTLHYCGFLLAGVGRGVLIGGSGGGGGCGGGGCVCA